MKKALIILLTLLILLIGCGCQPERVVEPIVSIDKIPFPNEKVREAFDLWAEVGPMMTFAEGGIRSGEAADSFANYCLKIGADLPCSTADGEWLLAEPVEDYVLTYFDTDAETMHENDRNDRFYPHVDTTFSPEEGYYIGDFEPEPPLADYGLLSYEELSDTRFKMVVAFRYEGRTEYEWPKEVTVDCSGGSPVFAAAHFIVR